MRKKSQGALVERQCVKCESPFMALATNVRKGKGKFCSPECLATHRQKAAMIGYIDIDPSPTGGWEMIFGTSYDEIATQCLLLPRHEPVG